MRENACEYRRVSTEEIEGPLPIVMTEASCMREQGFVPTSHFLSMTSGCVELLLQVIYYKLPTHELSTDDSSSPLAILVDVQRISIALGSTPAISGAGC